MNYHKLYEILPKKPIYWTISDTSSWLRFIGLSSLSSKFKQFSIDGSNIGIIKQQEIREQIEVSSTFVIRKLMYWIQTGLKQYTEFVKEREQSSQNESTISKSGVSSINNSFFWTTEVDDVALHEPESKNLFVGVKKRLKRQRFEVKQQKLSENREHIEKGMVRHSQLILHQLKGSPHTYYSIKENGARIGRHPSNSIVIDDITISRCHAEIKEKDNRFYIQDLGSYGGTYIKIEEMRPIHDKMLIQIGSNILQASVSDNNLTWSIVQGPSFGRKLPVIKAKEVSIGRDYSNFINLSEDEQLSSFHCRILFIDQHYYIKDSGSTNGTWELLSHQSQSSEPCVLFQSGTFRFGPDHVFKYKTNYTFHKERNMQNSCIICCDKPKDCVLMPCKHLASCIRCSRKLKNCPICRNKIQDMMRIQSQ